MERNGKGKIIQMTQTNPTETMWHQSALLQCRPKPNAIPNWYDKNVGELISIVVNYVFARQVKRSSHHMEDESAGGCFWPLWLQAEIPTTTRKWDSVRSVFTWFFCGEIILLWVMILRHLLGYCYTLANKETAWQNNPESRFWVYGT